jgi:hypothetical protein
MVGSFSHFIISTLTDSRTLSHQINRNETRRTTGPDPTKSALPIVSLDGGISPTVSVNWTQTQIAFAGLISHAFLGELAAALKGHCRCRNVRSLRTPGQKVLFNPPGSQPLSFMKLRNSGRSSKSIWPFPFL